MIKNEPRDLKEIDVLLKMYEEHCSNLRAFIELRFKHFTTFVALSSLVVGGIIFKLKSINLGIGICFFGLAMTALFWIIDFRTYMHMKETALNINKIVKVFDEEFEKVTPFKIHSERKFVLSSSQATNVLFALFLFGWVIATFHFAILRFQFKNSPASQTYSCC